MRWALVAVIATLGCSETQDCWRDQEGLVWTNQRLMQSFEHRRDKIGGDLLCYPNTGQSNSQLERGVPCGHPRQQVVTETVVVDGKQRSILVCRCTPRPDVLFTSDDVARWCRYPP